MPVIGSRPFSLQADNIACRQVAPASCAVQIPMRYWESCGDFRLPTTYRRGKTMGNEVQPKSEFDKAAEKINEAADMLRDTVATNKAELSKGASMAMADAKKRLDSAKKSAKSNIAEAQKEAKNAGRLAKREAKKVAGAARKKLVSAEKSVEKAVKEVRKTVKAKVAQVRKAVDEAIKKAKAPAAVKKAPVKKAPAKKAPAKKKSR
jgi:hypothetical protein